MIQVIRRIEIYTIPARWEPQGSHDTIWANALWERNGFVLTGACGVHAGVCELAEASGFLLGTSVDVADEHTEALFASYISMYAICACV
jgi:hypothetical protein